MPTDSPVTRLEDRVLVRTSEGTFSGLAVRSGDSILVSFRGRTFKFQRRINRTADAAVGSGNITAPMPGMIVEVPAKAGEKLGRGAKVAVLEAMKTQLPLIMPFDGVVDQLFVQVGQQVEQDAPIATIVAEKAN